MIKLAIAIASKTALPSAFVVFRGFSETIPRAAALGYHGVELALKDAGEIRPQELDALLGDNGLEVACISTGQITFYRSAFAMVPILLYLALRGDLRRAFHTTNLTGHLSRGFIGILAMSCGF